LGSGGEGCVHRRRSTGPEAATPKPGSQSHRNIWALLDDRLDRTAPNGFETEKKFMGRVRAAVRYLNTEKLDDLKSTVSSMPTRVQEVLTLKGGMTKY